MLSQIPTMSNYVINFACNYQLPLKPGDLLSVILILLILLLIMCI